MIREISTIGFVILLLEIAPFATAGTWTTLDMPGAYWTKASGIDGVNIVGTYADASGTHGFLYNGSSWTNLDMPGASLTYAYSIDGSNIVGSYEIGTNFHGFLYDGTSWTIIDTPGSRDTYITGISGNNMVGYYRDSSWDWHSFLYDGSIWTTFPNDVWACGINGNMIVGGSGTNGFLYDGSNWTTFHTSGPTTARDVYGDYIVGYYLWGLHTRGFLYDGANWTILDMPGASDTFSSGIYGDRIVGYYYYGDSDLPNGGGFIYTIPEPSSLLLFGAGFIGLFLKRAQK
jgi:hypothetical protein